MNFYDFVANSERSETMRDPLESPLRTRERKKKERIKGTLSTVS